MTTDTASPRTGSVQSVERAFELIEIIANAGGEITLSGLAAAAELPLPTIHRLLRTLLTMGYVRQLPSRRYALGARLIFLGDKASLQIGAGTRPELQQLVAELGETANMAMLDQDMVVYVAQVPSPHAMRMFTEVGRRAHLHDTGVGKAILATLEDSTISRLIGTAGMPTPTVKSHRDLDSVLTDVQRIRQRGYSIDDEEQELGVRCYAVAVPDAATPMAVSVSGPLTRVDLAFGDRAVPLLQAAAVRIGLALS